MRPLREEFDDVRYPFRPVRLGACLLGGSLAIGGDLTPPGAPAPSMKTLDEVEPQIPIGPLTTPGDADSVTALGGKFCY